LNPVSYEYAVLQSRTSVICVALSADAGENELFVSHVFARAFYECKHAFKTVTE